eukprot:TRINITY_DN1168_c0_g5_i3.p1 TRINITY_DN1168_c0_g5~~TRINITY_DN1168_c0_g5_i3.p1  ORF type:complete len:103 (-),score=8.78 TRINITY_DN1168_c0_g5_i3:581-889(-)
MNGCWWQSYFDSLRKKNFGMFEARQPSFTSAVAASIASGGLALDGFREGTGSHFKEGVLTNESRNGESSVADAAVLHGLCEGTGDAFGVGESLHSKHFVVVH